MKNIKFMTLAAARAADSQKFDEAVVSAVTEAIARVGAANVARSLSAPLNEKQLQKVAA